MNTNIVNEVTARQLKKDVPAFSSGDTVKVSVRIIENKKNVSKSSKASLCNAAAPVSVKPLPLEKSLQVSVLKELSQFIHQLLLKLKFSNLVKFVVVESPIYVNVLAKPLVLKKFFNKEDNKELTRYGEFFFL